MLIADLLYTFVSFNMTTSMRCSSMIWLILSDLDLKPLMSAYKKLHNPVLHAVCRLAELLDFLPPLIFLFLHLLFGLSTAAPHLPEPVQTDVLGLRMGFDLQTEFETTVSDLDQMSDGGHGTDRYCEAC